MFLDRTPRPRDPKFPDNARVVRKSLLAGLHPFGALRVPDVPVPGALPPGQVEGISVGGIAGLVCAHDEREQVPGVQREANPRCVSWV